MLRMEEAWASESLELRMYDKNAVLRHLPRALIVESGIPRSAAVVAAPILKLCPA